MVPGDYRPGPANSEAVRAVGRHGGLAVGRRGTSPAAVARGRRVRSRGTVRPSSSRAEAARRRGTARARGRSTARGRGRAAAAGLATRAAAAARARGIRRSAAGSPCSSPRHRIYITCLEIFLRHSCECLGRIRASKWTYWNYILLLVRHIYSESTQSRDTCK